MRKAHKQITDVAVVEHLLQQAPVGRLGTIGPDGWPMVKPLNFAYNQGAIYFHCALLGEKLDHIRNDARVCFEVDQPIAFLQGREDLPCRADYLYRSVIIRGRASLLETPEEKSFALACLMNKYQPGIAWKNFPPEKLAVTAVVRIGVEEMVGREDLGNDEQKARVLALLESGATLPVAFD